MFDDEAIRLRSEAVFTPALHHYYPFTIASGEGSTIVTTSRRRLLDFSSGLAVLNIGYNHPKVMKAVRDQLDFFVHTGSIYHNEVTLAAAEELVTVTPPGLNMLFFGNSGAEAVEASLKLARYVSGRQIIISFTGAFHGRTFGALSVTTSNSAYRRHYHPLLPSVYQLPYPACFTCPNGLTPESCGTRCLEEAVRLFERQVPPGEVAAMIVEPFLGEGGYYPAPPGFLKGLRNLCDEYGILLIFDEVQSGIGRTGKWFFSEYSGVVPDVVTVAKGIASGFPLSAVVAGKALMSRWEQGAHGTTFGGNPVSCAAALATLRTIREEGLLDHAREQGAYVMEALQEMAGRSPWIGEVRGAGLMIGIEFVDRSGAADGIRCAKFLEGCLERGLILINCGVRRNVARFIPPLTVSREELDKALGICAEALAEL